MFRTDFARCPLDGESLEDLEGDPLVGTVLDGRYNIVSCIGEGGMGRVYVAGHVRLSRNYAIKVLFGDYAGDRRMRHRFAREAQAISSLHHPHIVSVTDFGETEKGLLYLVMDRVVGKPLANIIEMEAPMSPHRIARLAGQMCQGLAHAHDSGLIHRDFKSENVIVTRDHEGLESARILDFGLCRVAESDQMSTQLTTEGVALGTPAVMSPEQVSGDLIDQRTDLYSLGVVIYQMLAGVFPFEGTPIEMARKNLYEPAISVHERSGLHVNPYLEAIAMRLLQKRPEHRFQSAHEVLQALEKLDAPVSTRLVDEISGPMARVATEPTETTARPRRQLAIVLGLVLAASVGGVLALLLGRDSGTAESEPIAAVTEPDVDRSATDPAAGNSVASAADAAVAGTEGEQATEEDPPAASIDAGADSTGGDDGTATESKQTTDRRPTSRKRDRRNRNRDSSSTKREISQQELMALGDEISRGLKALARKNPEAAAELENDLRAIRISAGQLDTSARPGIRKRLLSVKRRMLAAPRK